MFRAGGMVVLRDHLRPELNLRGYSRCGLPALWRGLQLFRMRSAHTPSFFAYVLEGVTCTVYVQGVHAIPSLTVRGKRRHTSAGENKRAAYMSAHTTTTIITTTITTNQPPPFFVRLHSE